MKNHLNNHKLKYILIFSLLSMVWGCDEPGKNGLQPVAVKHALTKFDSCDNFESYAKQAAIAHTTIEIENAKAEVEKYWFGDGDMDVISDADFEDDSADGNASGDADADGDMDISPIDGDGESDSTDTNVQEKGVDEADMIKTDGKFLYALNQDNLVIVQPSESGTLGVIGRAEVGGYAKELFLYGNQVIIFSSVHADSVPNELVLPRPEFDSNYPDMTDVDFDDEGAIGPGGGYTQITIFDVADKTAPALVRTITYNGRYISSRRIDNGLRAVIGTNIPYLDLPNYPNEAMEEDFWDMPEELAKMKILQAYDNRLAKNIEFINNVTLTQILPHKIDSAVGDQAIPISNCENMYAPTTPAGTDLLTVVSIDLTKPQEQQQDISIMGEEGLVYASSNALYLTTSTRYVREAWALGYWEIETSGIHKFDITTTPQTATYLATGSVSGHLLNQFCLGEHNGFLRVATTTGDNWNPDTLENHIFVLEQQSNKLSVVGQIDGLGKGEEVYAARFLGNRGFMVTYYEMDPLYTFDLTDPKNPQTIGEWHGPGYSTYLHPLGENHLISVGMSESSMALQLYDVSNFANPVRVDIEETGYWYSPALYDHKAFTFDNQRGLLAIPFVDEYEYDGSGTLLYQVDTQDISLKDKLVVNDIEDEESEEIFYDEGPVQRNVFINDTMYAISRCRITSANLNDLTQVLDTTPLFTGSECDDWYYWY